MFCTKCGHQIDDGSEFCSNCGASISKADNTAAQQNLNETETAVSSEQSAEPVQTPQTDEPFKVDLPYEAMNSAQATGASQPAQPAEPVQYSQIPNQQINWASAGAVQPKKKAPVAIIIIIAAVLLIGILVGCFFLFKAPLTKAFMSDEDYAESVITGYYDNLADTLGLEETLNYASELVESGAINTNGTNYDNTEIVGQAIDAAGTAVMTATNGKGFFAEYSVNVDINKEDDFISLFGSQIIDMLTEYKLEDYSIRTEFSGDDSAYQVYLSLLDKGKAAIDLQGYYGKNGEAFLSLPSLSDTSVEFSLPELSMKAAEKKNKDNKALQNIRKKFSEIIKDGDITIENDSISVGNASFDGQVVEVVLDSELIAEFLEVVNDEIFELLDVSSSYSPISSAIDFLNSDDTFYFTFKLFVNMNGSVAGGFLELKQKGDYPHSINAVWLSDNSNFAAEVKFDSEKILTVKTESESPREGVLSIVVNANGDKSTFKINYSDLGIASLFGRKTITGNFEFSFKPGESMSYSMNSSVAEALNDIKLKLSILPENGGIAYTVGAQYKKIGSVNLKALIGEASKRPTKPTGTTIDGESSSELVDFSNEIIEKIADMEDFPLAKSLKDYTNKSRVTSANSTAKSLKNTMDVALTELDTRGYGLKRGSNSCSLVNCKIRNGEWEIEFSDTGVLKNASDADSVISYMKSGFAEMFSDIQNGSVLFYVSGGYCTTVAYTADTANGIVPGTDCPNISSDGSWQNYGGFPWNGETAGITSSGLIVGTYPESYLDTYAEPYDEPGMNGISSSFQMPDLTGEFYDNILSDYNGLLSFNVIEQNSDYSKGTIIGQDISYGTEIDKGSSVTVYVSNGIAGEGKILNIYCWNDEFKGFFDKYYTVPEGITVNWIINPSDDGVYQQRLDAALQNQSTAAADDKVDLFLAEADYILKYVDSDYTMDTAKIGYAPADTTYKYTVEAATDSKGAVKGASFQCCPSALIYRRSIAKEVLGTDDPAEVQALLSDWTKFDAAAAKAKALGYYMTASFAETYRAFANNLSTPWVTNGKLTIPAEILEWTNQAEEYINNGYTLECGTWDYDKSEQMYASGRTMCFFGPSWYYNFCMGNAQDPDEGCYGDWAICEGPMAHFWGGTWLLVPTGTDNPETVADILNTFTIDEDFCYNLIESEGQFTNNSAANRRYANYREYYDDYYYYYGSSFLGGQNDVAVFVELAKNIKFENKTIYDQLLTEGLQGYWREYCDGAVTEDEAMSNYYKYINEKYPEIVTP